MGEEGLWYADLCITNVARERQNFDPAGHYSRPDVTRLEVNRTRQKTVTFKDSVKNSGPDTGPDTKLLVSGPVSGPDFLPILQNFRSQALQVLPHQVSPAMGFFSPGFGLHGVGQFE